MLFVLLTFIACAIIIFFAGRYVARYGDVIAEKMGLSAGGLWIGGSATNNFGTVYNLIWQIS